MKMMIFYVLDDPDHLTALLEAWKGAGVRGATIIESTGFHRILQHIPMRFFFAPQERVVEKSHTTLLAIVEDEARVQACLQATEALVGDLDQPHNGIFAAWPLPIVKGLPPRDDEE